MYRDTLFIRYIFLSVSIVSFRWIKPTLGARERIYVPYRFNTFGHHLLIIKTTFEYLLRSCLFCYWRNVAVNVINLYFGNLCYNTIVSTYVHVCSSAIKLLNMFCTGLLDIGNK